LIKLFVLNCVPILCKVIPPSRVGCVVFAGLLL
jgi:hypothetical protein